MLGLGLAVDYSCSSSAVTEKNWGCDADRVQAVSTTLQTAGRTVAMSGLIVATSLASLMLFPQVYLRSMGLGGVAAVLRALAASLTVLPALLAILGHRVGAAGRPNDGGPGSMRPRPRCLVPARQERDATTWSATGGGRGARSCSARPS